MLKSMTGFGKSEIIDGDYKIGVEIRSVNSRFGEINVKLPYTLTALESKVRSELKQKIGRGKLEVYISFENSKKSEHNISINTDLAKIYLEKIKELTANTNLKISDDVIFSELINMPNIVKPEASSSNNQFLAEIEPYLEKAIQAAFEPYNEMKISEGAALKRDLEGKISSICDLVGKIEDNAVKYIEVHQERLHSRMSKVLANLGAAVDENRFLNEIAFFCDKADISEEITRLKSHIEQFRASLNSPCIGKKLDFISQEMFREANTMGSKSTDINLSKILIEFKAIIEKIREQVQNIE